jgi:ferritin-like metal-binding protein YciE
MFFSLLFMINEPALPTSALINDDSPLQKAVLPTAQPALLDLLIEEVKDIYWIENYLVHQLPKWEHVITSFELKEGITSIIATYQDHVIRTRVLFEWLDEPKQAKKCFAMEDIYEEGEDLIEETEMGSATRDACIILSLQKMVYHTMAVYHNILLMSKILGMTEITAQVNTSLTENGKMNELLTDIAENLIYNLSSHEEST